jgi:hypothetical protein
VGLLILSTGVRSWRKEGAEETFLAVFDPICLPTDEWIKKMWCIYNGLLQSNKEE